jgi:Holliday junction resolvasome RuvABC endonuclease subunit
MRKILVGGIDPSLTAFGIARLQLDLDSLELSVEDLILEKTAPTKVKQVRRNSDDLSRAEKLYQAFHDGLDGCVVCFAEIPSGAQSARAALGFGIAIGVMASCHIPLIQVMPSETKLAVTGGKTATKSEMISWGTGKYPKAPWLKHRGKIVQDNEHLADAVAVAHAGVKTDEFKRLLAMWKSAPLAA